MSYWTTPHRSVADHTPAAVYFGRHSEIIKRKIPYADEALQSDEETKRPLLPQQTQK
jgi:hypothetical protein